MKLNSNGRDLQLFLEGAGFSLLRQGKIGLVYQHHQYPRNVTVTSHVTESQSRHMIENVSRVLCIPTPKTERQRHGTGNRTKAQAKAERERIAAEKRRQEYLDRVEQKDREAAEKAARLEKEQRDRDFIRINEYIEAKERARRRLLYDMSAVPIHARHEHTRHRA